MCVLADLVFQVRSVVINVVSTRVSEPTIWVDVYAILDLAVPDEAGTLHQLGVRDSLIR